MLLDAPSCFAREHIIWLGCNQAVLCITKQLAHYYEVLVVLKIKDGVRGCLAMGCVQHTAIGNNRVA